MRETFSPVFQEYLQKLDGQWFGYITEYRDALAHRIPLYIPKGVRPENLDRFNDLTIRMNEALGRGRAQEYDALCEEQDKLLVFQPTMTHSTSEAKTRYAFHAQLIADFLTIEELGQKMLAELRRTKD